MSFSIEFLDHVAIRVRDPEASAAWYEKVLGLKRLQPPEWALYPILLLAGKTGIALFPARLEDPPQASGSKNVKIDHFAFQLKPAEFEKARSHFANLGISFDFQDHHYFHSIYTNDPDGHRLELTCLVVQEKDFY